jgi:subtilisin family serine protease
VPSDGVRDAFPTGIAGVIAADAIENGHRDDNVMLVPGRDVLSLAPQGNYDFYSGSSLATAEVTGLIALLRSQRTHLSGQQAAALLSAATAAGQPIAPPSVPNACLALDLLLHKSDCTGS